MLKFPYGLADFYRLRTEGYVYLDRTTYLPLLEELGDQLLFLRPRRFGKSLLLSLLENYYDLGKADQFERLFGDLAIGQHPTPRHNQYFVLKWDFSMVSAVGGPEQIQQTLHDHLNGAIDGFNQMYQRWLSVSVPVNASNAIASLQALSNVVRQTPHRLYLLIDEYDNFANEVLMGAPPFEVERYKALLSGEGSLKTVFKAIKALSSGGGVEKVFITGVSPVVLSDLTSGYNIAKNIYLEPRFYDLCGFRESEVADLLNRLVRACHFPAEHATEALKMMRTFYNGYRFDAAAEECIYNPTLALYFFDHWQRRGQAPRQMLDSNLAMDRGKLRYIAQLPQGKELLVAALNDTTPVIIPHLADRFGVEDMTLAPKDQTFMASLLYYFGVLTLDGLTPLGKLRLKIPNVVIQELYVERLQLLLLPDLNRDELASAAETFFTTGNLQPVCDFIEQRYFAVFDNRDYRWANELTVKTAFLTLLFNDLWYLIDSEPALSRMYADLTLLVRPDMRQAPLLDVVLEFKYLSLADLRLSGADVRHMQQDDLRDLPVVQEQFAAARQHLRQYWQTLTATRSALRLHAYVVAALGFERLLWEEVNAEEADQPS